MTGSHVFHGFSDPCWVFSGRDDAGIEGGRWQRRFERFAHPVPDRILSRTTFKLTYWRRTTISARVDAYHEYRSSFLGSLLAAEIGANVLIIKED